MKNKQKLNKTIKTFIGTCGLKMVKGKKPKKITFDKPLFVWFDVLGKKHRTIVDGFTCEVNPSRGIKVTIDYKFVNTLGKDIVFT